MPKPMQPMSRRHPLGPQLQVEVTQELINTAVRGHSGHCMVAEAIRAAAPTAKLVAVDISTCRFSDLAKGYRYVYLTPRVAQEAIIDFDDGTLPKPFRFWLRQAHVTRAGHAQTGQAKKSPSRAPKTDGGVPARARLVGSNLSGRRGVRRVGGRQPPQLHIRRTFGLRAFRARMVQLEQAAAAAAVPHAES